jgi:signal transduction histidine kinase
MMLLRPPKLATRFLLIVALGAVLPLALVGLWLTRAAERSGRALLRDQIEHASTVIAAEIDRRWALREGELRLLAGNSSAQAIVGDRVAVAADSAYLVQLARSLSVAIPSITYRDAAGRDRWSYVRASDEKALDGTHLASAPEGPSRTIDVELPIADGSKPGTLLARVSLSSIVPSGIGRALVPGATLTIADARGSSLWGGGVEATSGASADATGAGGLETVSRSASHAPLRVVVAAPSAAYVQPFERAARIGVGVLMLVALVALAMSVALTTRITRSLHRLVDAATAVAAGDLQRSVHESADDEIGRLARAFNAMTESLRRTLSELSGQRALAAVGEFATSLSHEVRNSLTAVRVDLQHARRHLPPDNPETALVARALDSVRRLDATVSGALRVARSGQVSKTRVDLDVVLERAIRSAAPSFTERGATLDPISGSPSPPLEGDAAALEQLFLNLLINAAQASPPGGRARVERESSGAHVTVRVVDVGAGIDETLAPALGRPFMSTKPFGTGLGLPIAQRIVAAHGGELSFESAPDVGTTAVVRLPVPASRTVRSNELQAPTGPARHRRESSESDRSAN